MSVLSKFLSSNTRAEILRILFGLNIQELHLREIERRTSLGVSTLHKELKRLAELELVRVRKSSNRLYFSANTQHPLFPDINRLVLKTTGLADVLRDRLSDADIRIAFIFGSLARAEEGAFSDIDLMVIGNVNLFDLSTMLSGLTEQLGREVNPHAFTEEDIRLRYQSKEHFLYSVLKSELLFLIGTEDELRGLVEG